jgi:hypothetical protein
MRLMRLKSSGLQAGRQTPKPNVVLYQPAPPDTFRADPTLGE